MLLGLALSGCQEQILHDLSETEANRVVSRLYSAQINAEKVVQADGRWAVSVEREGVVAALTYLDSARVLSNRQAPSNGKSHSSLVPSREEQWFQYESSIAAAIESTLMTLPGVFEARVHLNLPQTDPLLGARSAGVGSGSVLLVADSQCSIGEGEIAALVGGAAGVPAGNVKVLRSLGARSSTGNEQILPGAPAPVRPVALAAASAVFPFEEFYVGMGTLALALVLLVVGLRRKSKRVRSPFALGPLADHEA